MPQKHRTARTQPRRHGNHQKRTGHFLKVYHPFLPLLLVFVFAASLITFTSLRSNDSTTPNVISSEQKPGVLAYATSISSDGLLSATNQRRSTAGVGGLSINGQLTQAAQAKANDMANRNYWAHNTPEGTPPWAFITNAGYSYSRAGENLACGFNESSEVVTGWYNSPTHRDNLLSDGYIHVGFGIANAANYNCGNFPAGQQTIIVAMYGSPYSAPASQPPASTPAPQTQPAASQPAASAPANAPASATAVAKHTVKLTVKDIDGNPSPGIKVTLYSEPRSAITDKNGVATFTDVETGKHKAVVEIEGAKTETDIDLNGADPEFKLTLIKPILASNRTSRDGSLDKTVVQPQTVSRLDLFLGNNVGWTLIVLTVLALAGTCYILVKHSIAAHRFFIKGEQYVLKHKFIDAAVVVLLIAIYILTRNVGAIL